MSHHTMPTVMIIMMLTAADNKNGTASMKMSASLFIGRTSLAPQVRGRVSE